MHRRVGSSGLRIAPLALGTMTWGNAVDRHEASDHVRAFLDAGCDLIDTAYGYGGGDAETFIGEMLDQAVSREDLVICTKSGIHRVGDERRVDVSRRTLMHQLDTSLGRLRTDHVDLWLAHTWSDDVPLEETLSALEWAVATGRARYVGVSNYTGWQVSRALTLLEQARVPLVVNEIQYSLVEREPEREVLPAAETLGFGVLAWSPLGAACSRASTAPAYRPGRAPPPRTSRASPNGSSTTRPDGCPKRSSWRPVASASLPARWRWPGSGTGPESLLRSSGRGREHSCGPPCPASSSRSRPEIVEALDDVSARP